MSEVARRLEPLSIPDYLTSEPHSPVKREYVGGYLYAQAGAGARHNRIVTNLTGHLWLAARGGPCQVYSSDMKLRVETAIDTRFYYPDVLVTCNPNDDDELYKVAPCLLAEVLSPSTESVDRREKLLAYRVIPSLRHYLVVSASERYVEHYRRDGQGAWWRQECRDTSVLSVDCVDLDLALYDLYEGV